MYDVELFLQPFGDDEAVMRPMIVHNEHRGSGILYEWVDLGLEEEEEVLLVGGPGDLPMQYSTTRR